LTPKKVKKIVSTKAWMDNIRAYNARMLMRYVRVLSECFEVSVGLSPHEHHEVDD
jgi:hypothetical protein